ncbi:DUF805 domain-containing protein [Parasphingorhabdus sp.]|uniref:DUF805 domain-containing protein n=1 Tax=Parasphingorhabdus sp. TaxID=2709688 RepID=UPI003298B828
MGPITAISTVLCKTFTYSGRASRSEYWWYYLACFILAFICLTVDSFAVLKLVALHGDEALLHAKPFAFTTLWALVATAPAFLSVTVRRLHDAGFSGFWTLLNFVPLGALVLVILHMLPSRGSTTVHGTPAAGPKTSANGRPLTVDAHKRAMQGYALLYDTDKTPTPEMQAARKAEISDYYRNNVLKAAPSA